MQEFANDQCAQVYLNKIRKYVCENDDRFSRLKMLVEGTTNFSPKDIQMYMVYFLRIFNDKPVVTMAPNGAPLPRCTDFEYSCAVARFTKCYFDFESIPGKGKLVCNGVINPPIEIRQPGKKDSTLKDCLPRLIAYQWLIQLNLDKCFWVNLHKIKSRCDAYNQRRKKRYGEQHYMNTIRKKRTKNNARPVNHELLKKDKKQPNNIIFDVKTAIAAARKKVTE